MNDDVIDMIRMQYAINSIYYIANEPAYRINQKENLIKQCQDELSLSLKEEKDGTKRAINGDYVKRIFDDMASKTGIVLGRNTYRRVMGILESNGNFCSNTKSCIMSYLGIRGISWDEFLNDSSSYKPQKQEDLFNISGVGSLYGIPRNTIHHVHLPLLEQYDIVILEMGRNVNTNVHMKVILECLKKGVFKVKDSRGLHLENDDVIYTDASLLKGNMLAFYKVNRANHWITYIGSHPIKRIEVGRLSEEEIAFREHIGRQN